MAYGAHDLADVYVLRKNSMVPEYGEIAKCSSIHGVEEGAIRKSLLWL
jgi:hypothetical protein